MGGACWQVEKPPAHKPPTHIQRNLVAFGSTPIDIMLSGWRQGTCYVRDNCFGTGPSDGSSTAGQQVIFTSSRNIYVNSGFEICIGDPCVATTSPSDDGSNGTFYCANAAGTIGRYAGHCSCHCNPGFAGDNCEVCGNNPALIILGLLLACLYAVVPLWLLWRTTKNVRSSLSTGEDYLTEIKAISRRCQEEADRGSVTNDLDVLATDSYKAAVVGVILGSFEGKCWWWKVCLMIEQAVLAVVVLTKVNPTFATAIVLFGWLSSIYARPYWNDAEDWVDLISRTSTLFTIIAANLIHLEVVTDEEVWLGVSLCSSAMVTIVLLIHAIGPQRVFRGAAHYVKRNIRWRKIVRV
ncbi:hypothetical protein TrLO_g3068 [Triparma laevis f. longispina]|uniref:EGF-like domain-containing protein n=1 Tax=Triparma laevis f. longispina TaxID=1714387 RepID=A0A9W7F6Q3_9STRA|nr:hypothetical protein TrLO_g3068 [Triparma laevis f. longispina]